MKEKLRQIYDALSNGRLSHKDALEQIRAIKTQQSRAVLLAYGEWEGKEVEREREGVNGEHDIILCELSKIDAEGLGALLPGSRCASLQAGEGRTIAERYSEYAAACLERIQAIMRRKPQGRVLVQVVIPKDREQAVLAGVSGLLKTAALENPQLITQLILASPDTTTDDLRGYVEAEKTGGLPKDPVIKYEQGVRQALRWQEVTTDQGQPAVAFKEQGV